jgi:hypothetical protein
MSNDLAQPARSERSVWRTQTVVLAVVLAFVLVAGAFLIGRNSARPQSAIRIDKTITGTVTVLDDTSAAGCVQPTTGAKVCSVILKPADTPLRVGDTIRVVRVWMTVAPNYVHDALVLISPHD